MCKPCKQTFPSRVDFKIHWKRVHENQTDRIICKECLDTFDTAWNLKTHWIQIHSKAGRGKGQWRILLDIGQPSALCTLAIWF